MPLIESHNLQTHHTRPPNFDWCQRTIFFGMQAETSLSIILLFDQQMEPPHSLLRPKNSHINQRKIRKIKITHHCHYDKNRPKIPLCRTKYSTPYHYKEINPTIVINDKNRPKIPLCLTKYNPSCHYKETKTICNIVMRLQTTSIG